MDIGHIALYVTDLEQSRRFYETYFGGKAGKPYHNPNTGLRSYFLSFSQQGARLELMQRSGLQQRPEAMQYGYAHLAFQLESREAVAQLTERLARDGYTVCSGPRVTGDGYYESCVLDPEGNQVEIVA